MTSNIGRATEFFEAWNRRSLDAIVARLAPDCRYHNMPMAPIDGREAIENYIAPVVRKAKSIDWIVIAIAEDADGRVLNERLDRLQFDNGWLEIPIMGLLEFSTDGITLWRDYFDLVDYREQRSRLGLA